MSREQTGPQSLAPAPSLLSCCPSSPASRAIIQDLDPSPIFGNWPMWHGGLWKWADGVGESWAGGPYWASRFPGTPTTISQIQPGQGLFLHHSELRRANIQLSRTPGWKTGMGVGQCDHEHPGEEGLQELVSGGRSALGSFFLSFPWDSDPWSHCSQGYNVRLYLGLRCQGIANGTMSGCTQATMSGFFQGMCSP